MELYISYRQLHEHTNDTKNERNEKKNKTNINIVLHSINMILFNLLEKVQHRAYRMAKEFCV